MLIFARCYKTWYVDCWTQCCVLFSIRTQQQPQRTLLVVNIDWPLFAEKLCTQKTVVRFCKWTEQQDHPTGFKWNHRRRVQWSFHLFFTVPSPRGCLVPQTKFQAPWIMKHCKSVEFSSNFKAPLLQTFLGQFWFFIKVSFNTAMHHEPQVLSNPQIDFYEIRTNSRLCFIKN